MNHKEYDLQVAICEMLDLKKVFYHSIPNEAVGGGPKAMRRMSRFKKTGLLPGVGDLLILNDANVAHYMEVKAPTGKISQSQKDFQERCAYRNLAYEVVRSVDDALGVLRFWEII